MGVGTKRKDPLLLLMAGKEAEKSRACSWGPRLIVQGNMSCPNRAARSAISSLDRISKLSSNDRNVLWLCGIAKKVHRLLLVSSSSAFLIIVQLALSPSPCSLENVMSTHTLSLQVEEGEPVLLSWSGQRPLDSKKESNQ